MAIRTDSAQIPCHRKRSDATILPVTVTNNSKHNVSLPGRVVLGRLQLVRSVARVEVETKRTRDGDQGG